MRHCGKKCTLQNEAKPYGMGSLIAARVVTNRHESYSRSLDRNYFHNHLGNYVAAGSRPILHACGVKMRRHLLSQLYGDIAHNHGFFTSNVGAQFGYGVPRLRGSGTNHSLCVQVGRTNP
jgi:hypothetical protein